MKRTDSSLEKIYEKDPSTGSFIIAVAIDNYADIFNELDPSPFKNRDLNNELRIYLEDSSADIPLKYDIILQFNILTEVQEPKREERIAFGLKTYFSFIERQLQREIQGAYQKGLFYVGVAFILLFVAYFLGSLSAHDVVTTTALEGITIGGWVFLWEAISTFAFKNRGIRTRSNHYKRFMAAPIRFKFTANTAGT